MCLNMSTQTSLKQQMLKYCLLQVLGFLLVRLRFHLTEVLGIDFTMSYAQETGLRKPLCFHEKPDGLKVPSSDFTVKDVW